MVEVTEKMMEEADEQMPDNLKGLYFQSDLKQALEAALDASDEIRKLQEQRDELLKALKEIMAWAGDGDTLHGCFSKARKAIAKAEEVK